MPLDRTRSAKSLVSPPEEEGRRHRMCSACVAKVHIRVLCTRRGNNPVSASCQESAHTDIHSSSSRGVLQGGREREKDEARKKKRQQQRRLSQYSGGSREIYVLQVRSAKEKTTDRTGPEPEYSL